MKDWLKDKRILAAGVIVLVLVILGGAFLFQKISSPADTAGVNALPTQVPIPTITAEDLGFTLEAGGLDKSVIATINNAEGITAIDYELSYTSKGDIPRGAIGSFDLKRKPVFKEIILGTCSDVCHYDENVTNIKLVLKITKEDGKIYQAEKTLKSID